MVSGKKGQASFEFLGTYAWALFALVIVFSGLYFFGVFDSGDRIPDSCVLGDGIACSDVAIERVDSLTYLVDLGLVNTNDEKVGVQSIRIRKKGTSEYCASSQVLSRSGNLIDTNISSLGSRKEISFVVQNGVNCTFLSSGIELEPDVREQFDIILVYTKGRSNLPVTSSGMVYATIEGNETTFVTPPGCMISPPCGPSKCGTDATGYSKDYGNTCFVDSNCGTPCTPQNQVPYFDGLYTVYNFEPHTSFTVGNLSLLGRDDDDGPDPLTFYLGLPPTTNVFDCSIVGAILSCMTNNPGTDTFNVTVDDGADTFTETIRITVANAVNIPPEWSDTLQTIFQYNQTEIEKTLIANMNVYAFDADSLPLPLSFYINETIDTNNSVASCSVEEPAKLLCKLLAYGVTSFNITVSDGQDTDNATINLKLFNSTVNQAPYFTSNLTEAYFFDISESPVAVVDLALYSEDYEGDTMYYYLDDLAISGEISCSLNGSNLKCTLNYVGTTSVFVIVGDNWTNSTAKELKIKVTNTSLPTNNPPYFSDLITNYTSIYTGTFTPVNLSNFAFDDDSLDPMYFYLDKSKLNPLIVDCDLSDSILKCGYNAVGETILGVIVGDGIANASTAIKFNLTSSGAPDTCKAESSCCLGTGGYSKDGGINCYADSACTDSVCIYVQTVNFDDAFVYVSVPVNDSRTLFEALKDKCDSKELLSLMDDEGNKMYYNTTTKSCVNVGIGEERLLDGYVAIVNNIFSIDFKGPVPSSPKNIMLYAGKPNSFSVPITANPITVNEIFKVYLGNGLINITNDVGEYYKESIFSEGEPDDTIITFKTGEGYLIYTSQNLSINMSAYIK